MQTAGRVPRADEVIATVAEVASEKKASSAVALMVGEYLNIVDWFVVVSAPNRRQVRTLLDEIDKRLDRLGVVVLGREGQDASEWVLLDCGEAVIHIMTEECREFYALERLWAGAPSRDLLAKTPAAASTPESG